MEMSVYLFVENGFMALLRLIYHFCRILFAYPFLQTPFCIPLFAYPFLHTPSAPNVARPPDSGGHCGMCLVNENS